MGWKNIGSITVAAEAGDYAPTARAKKTLEAITSTKRIIFGIPSNMNVMQLRVRSDGSENDENVLLLLGVSGEDHYTPIATLTCVQGAQVESEGIYFADSIVSSAKAWLTTMVDVKQDSPADEMASFGINTHDYDRFVFVCLTKAEGTTTIYVDVRRA
jgi:hypothetical protein